MDQVAAHELLPVPRAAAQVEQTEAGVVAGTHGDAPRAVAVGADGAERLKVRGVLKLQRLRETALQYRRAVFPEHAIHQRVVVEREGVVVVRPRRAGSLRPAVAGGLGREVPPRHRGVFAPVQIAQARLEVRYRIVHARQFALLYREQEQRADDRLAGAGEVAAPRRVAPRERQPPAAHHRAPPADMRREGIETRLREARVRRGAFVPRRARTRSLHHGGGGKRGRRIGIRR